MLLLTLSLTMAIQDPPSAGLSEVLACRQIADAQARLACFDAAAINLQQAEQTGDIVVIDRADVRDTQRRLFGFRVPELPVLSRGDRPENLEEIVETLSRFTTDGSGRYTFTLSDGSVWRQTDSQTVRTPPRVGATATIRRAAFNSYMIDFGPGRSIRVERRD